MAAATLDLTVDNKFSELRPQSVGIRNVVQDNACTPGMKLFDHRYAEAEFRTHGRQLLFRRVGVDRAAHSDTLR